MNFEVWEHKEIKITTLLIPFILSFVGVIGVSYAIFRIYKKYNVDVENARIRYNIQENELDT